MWVVYNTLTGIEYDTYETAAEARHTIIILNGESDMDLYGMRKED